MAATTAMQLIDLTLFCTHTHTHAHEHTRRMRALASACRYEWRSLRTAERLREIVKTCCGGSGDGSRGGGGGGVKRSKAHTHSHSCKRFAVHVCANSVGRAGCAFALAACTAGCTPIVCEQRRASQASARACVCVSASMPMQLDN